jgi:hypothetical protein
VKCDEVLEESIKGAVDFFKVIDDDTNYPDSSTKSLTKLNPQKPSLSETVLGNEFNRNDIRVVEIYSFNWVFSLCYIQGVRVIYMLFMQEGAYL